MEPSFDYPLGGRTWVSLLAIGWVACGPPPPPEEPSSPSILTTYRVVAGASMGGMGAAALGFRRPERFDGVASLGGPLDAALLLRSIDRFHLGGFCSLAELEAIAAKDPVRLNDPAEIAACSKRPATIELEHSQDFNHWVYTDNGGAFSRDTYLNMFSDLTLAYGSLLYENPESPFAPPGVEAERLRHPPSDFCTNPVRIKGLRNAEYNPQGKYDVITFCDGQPRLFLCQANQELVNFCSDPSNIVNPLEVEQAQGFANAYCQGKGGAEEATGSQYALFRLNHGGAVDPCRRAQKPMTVALAVDINGNGRRDYGEPILVNAQERFDDVGSDGCADAYENGEGGCLPVGISTGDPNGDNYHVDDNPRGTEQNWIWDEGEPFRDDGLDGVPQTADYGEGNGRYDRSSGRQRLMALDARTNMKNMPESSIGRLSVMMDGGVRDVFNLGVAAKHVFSLVRALHQTPAGSYRDFIEIPGMVDRRSGQFNPWNARWKTLPRDLLVLYGKNAPSDQDRLEGDGDHVGTTTQAVHRFYTFFNWAAASWPSLERPSTPFGGASAADRQQIVWYESKVLGAKRDFGISLPPGYELPENQDRRYPVLYLMHGYGMDAVSFMGTSLITDAYVTDPEVQLRPLIIVFPSGRCCFIDRGTGARDCRETDDQGVPLTHKPGFERECHSGNFYVNQQGYSGRDGRPYGDAFFELMEYVDQHYRTLAPAEVEQR